ncbi:hypothetical protein LA10_04193 [Thermotoga neapolitana LA10]|nr:hypothetical protein LA10_04193 [Thermotoga neapolitana LA10]
MDFKEIIPQGLFRKQEYKGTYRRCFITGDSNTQKGSVKYCLEKWNKGA